MKKLMLALALMAMPISVYGAESNIKVDGAVDINSTGGGDAEQILVTVPTALYFTVTPNEEQLVTSVPDNITNHGSRPVTVGMIGYEAFSDNGCKVVNQDKYTDADWMNLGVSDTESQISLGLKHKGNVYWSLAGVNSESTAATESFNILSNGEEEIEVAVKCGTAWSSDRVLDYNLYLVLS